MLLVQPLNYTVFTALLAAVLIAAAGLALFGSYPRTERVTGYVKPSRGVVEIAGDDAGTLGVLHVQAGDRVDAGQSLATLITESQAPGGVSAAGHAVSELSRQLGELETMIDALPTEIERRDRRLGVELDELDAQLDHLQQQQLLQQDIVASAQHIFDLATERQSSALSKTEFEQRRRQTLLARRDLAQLGERIAAFRARRANVLAARDELPFERTRRMVELQSRASELRQRRVEWTARREQILIAPVAGTVADVRTTFGARVEAGETVLAILPEGGRLRAEVFVDSRAIGFVNPGKEVLLDYAAYPKERFGTHRGWVGEVGGVILTAGDIDTPSTLTGPAYRVIVELESENVWAQGISRRLRPGMLLEADLILENRSLLQWVLGPVLRRDGDDHAI